MVGPGRPPPLDMMTSIPAFGREPPSSPVRIRFFWVYPRVCGGTAGLGYIDSDAQGLSPRVRGNQFCRDLRYPPVTVYPHVSGGTPWGIVSGSVVEVKVGGFSFTVSQESLHMESSLDSGAVAVPSYQAFICRRATADVSGISGGAV